MSAAADFDSVAVRTLRADLALALRAADHHALSEGVCNHFSVAAPGSDDRFLINPQGLHWSEIVPADIVTVDVKGNRVEGRHEVEPTAFFIHARLHRSKRKPKVVLHTHMPYATALTILEGGRLEPASQNALRFYGRVGYDETYNGLALDDGEGERIAARLNGGDVLFLANHGVIVCGENIAWAFDDLYYLERACQTLALAYSTGQRLNVMSPAVAERTARGWEQYKGAAFAHFEEMKQTLDVRDPSYRD
jgi:ribulose-5-phosphate 4-epimerase/fuculose-1-phosphate aldolase